MGTSTVSTPVQAASAIVGDAWSVLVLREVLLLHRRRFVDFRNALGLNRSTLSSRLRQLVAAGLLERAASGSSQEQSEYVPTDDALAFVPVLLCMVQWSRRWEVDPNDDSLLEVRHKSRGGWLDTTLTCQSCRGRVDARSVEVERPGPLVRRPRPRTRHRAPRFDLLERARPCPIARYLSIAGDRWSVLLVQEAFFGVHEFDAFQQRLAIAPNILSDRLSRFCRRGILEKRPPSVGQRRGYFLTEKGLELYPVAAMVRQWAIEIRGVEEPLAYSHRWCGARLALALSCTRCGEEANSSSIEARVPEHVSRTTPK